MKYNNTFDKLSTRGFAPIIILAIFFGVLAVGGVAYFAGKSSAPKPEVSDNSNYYPPVEQNQNTNPPVITNTNPQENQQVQNNNQNSLKCNSNSYPSITLLSPNGGEVFKVGDIMQVKYSSCNMPNNHFDRFDRYELQTYDAKSGEFIGSVRLEGAVMKPGIMEWKIPSLIDSTRKHKIYLDYGYDGDGNPADISDNFFIINGGVITDCIQTTKPWIKILSPNGGEIYQKGQEIQIKWETCNAKTGQTISLNISQVNSSGIENPVISFFQPPHQIGNPNGKNIVNAILGPSYSTNNNWPFSSGSNFKVSVIMNLLSISTGEPPFLKDSSNNTFTIN